MGEDPHQSDYIDWMEFNKIHVENDRELCNIFSITICFSASLRNYRYLMMEHLFLCFHFTPSVHETTTLTFGRVCLFSATGNFTFNWYVYWRWSYLIMIFFFSTYLLRRSGEFEKQWVQWQTISFVSVQDMYKYFSFIT